jgi:hypothetical protein
MQKATTATSERDPVGRGWLHRKERLAYSLRQNDSYACSLFFKQAAKLRMLYETL